MFKIIVILLKSLNFRIFSSYNEFFSGCHTVSFEMVDKRLTQSSDRTPNLLFSSSKLR